MDFTIPADHNVQLKESEKSDTYLFLGRELKKKKKDKKQWNTKVTVIPIVIGTLGTVAKGDEDLEIRGPVETIQTIRLLDRSEYWDKSRGLEVTCCHSDSNESPPANACVNY